MKITLYTYVLDCGDGSYSVKYFKTQEEREVFLMKEEDSTGYYTDSEGTLEIEVDENNKKYSLTN